MYKKNVMVLGAKRTAIGSFGGSLKDIPLSTLATEVVRAAVAQSNVRVEDVGHVVMGNVVPTEPRDAYLSRVAAIDSGLPIETPAFNVNRLCGSGIQAIISSSQSIAMGDTQVAVAAGAESMSRGLYMLPSARWGARMGNTEVLDFMTGILHDPWKKVHMGITAENVAERYGISRQTQDELAFESQRRAIHAIDNGYFKEQIVPIKILQKRMEVAFEVDEHVRRSTSIEELSAMRPVFKKDGLVTAGNASGINDGAAAMVLADEHYANSNGLKPLARLVGYAHAGVDPLYMGIGPVPASRKVLQSTGLRVEDMDVIESNEAFAAQACAVSRELNFDPKKVNPNGSGISLGHPVGATGVIIALKAIYELHRINGRYALVTMCIGGGQGISLVLESV